MAWLNGNAPRILSTYATVSAWMYERFAFKILYARTILAVVLAVVLGTTLSVTPAVPLLRMSITTPKSLATNPTSLVVADGKVVTCVIVL